MPDQGIFDQQTYMLRNLGIFRKYRSKKGQLKDGESQTKLKVLCKSASKCSVSRKIKALRKSISKCINNENVHSNYRRGFWGRAVNASGCKPGGKIASATTVHDNISVSYKTAYKGSNQDRLSTHSKPKAKSKTVTIPCDNESIIVKHKHKVIGPVERDILSITSKRTSSSYDNDSIRVKIGNPSVTDIKDAIRNAPDLYRKIFGPTLDETILCGVDLLRKKLGNKNRAQKKSQIQEGNTYKFKFEDDSLSICTSKTKVSYYDSSRKSGTYDNSTNSNMSRMVSSTGLSNTMCEVDEPLYEKTEYDRKTKTLKKGHARGFCQINSKNDPSRSNKCKSDPDKSDPGKSDIWMPEPWMPDSKKPEHWQPDAGDSDSSKHVCDRVDSGSPDLCRPLPSTPDSGKSSNQKPVSTRRNYSENDNHSSRDSASDSMSSCKSRRRLHRKKPPKPPPKDSVLEIPKSIPPGHNETKLPRCPSHHDKETFSLVPCIERSTQFEPSLMRCCANKSVTKNIDCAEKEVQKNDSRLIEKKLPTTIFGESPKDVAKPNYPLMVPCETRFAITKILKYDDFTTYEIYKSTKAKPKCLPELQEGIFVLKNRTFL